MEERTLLLVDDEPNVLNALKRLLRQQGYQILTASIGISLYPEDGEQAEVLMDDVQQSSETLRLLRAMEVAIAIDDFGTGYCSLSYLKEFPVDMLKIDQSFVRDITCNPQDMEIVNSIITMAHGLDLRVIAEGVETEEQLQLLSDLGCDQIQGYLIGRPLTIEQATELLQKSANQPLLKPRDN